MPRLLFYIFSIWPSLLIGQNQPFLDAHISKLDNARKYTQAVAELMPDSLYGFKPIETEFSFKEQLIHLSENLVWLSSTYISEKKQSFPIEKEILKQYNKRELLKIVDESYQLALDKIRLIDSTTLLKTFPWGKSGQMNKYQFLNLIQDHQTHHRGQLIVYLRLSGIAPPKYVGW